MRSAARAALLLVASVGLAIAAAWSARQGYADYWFQQETAEATEKALALTPDQSAYCLRLALLKGDDDPARAIKLLRRAVALNPSDGRSWVELGLRYEEAGDFDAAERNLQRAAEEDKTYLPRWTLMNYYFRRNDAELFWFWAKAAVPMIYGDPAPLFHLCGRVVEDGGLIDRLEIRKPQIRAGYLYYLLDIGRADLLGGPSRQLLEGSRDTDVPLLLDACDRLIAANRVDDAVAIWQGLLRARRLPFQTPREELNVLNNGDFAVSPTGRGFDWRLPPVEGISAAREENPAGLRLTFSGMQPERAEPLAQFVPVRGSSPYQLKFDYQTAKIDKVSGLTWRVMDAASNVELARGADMLSDDPSTGGLEFKTPAGCHMLRVSMVYERRSGTTRISGYLVLRGLTLKESGQTH